MSCSANYRLSSLVAEPLHARDEIHVSAAQLWLTPCCVPTALKRFKENLKNDNHTCSQPTSYAVLLDSLCVRGRLPQPTTVNVRLTFSATTLHQCSNVGTKCQCQKKQRVLQHMLGHMCTALTLSGACVDVELHCSAHGAVCQRLVYECICSQ